MSFLFHFNSWESRFFPFDTPREKNEQHHARLRRSSRNFLIHIGNWTAEVVRLDKHPNKRLAYRLGNPPIDAGLIHLPNVCSFARYNNKYKLIKRYGSVLNDVAHLHTNDNRITCNLLSGVLFVIANCPVTLITIEDHDSTLKGSLLSEVHCTTRYRPTSNRISDSQEDWGCHWKQ